MALNISIRQLDAFLTLAECRHFTRAAERCHLSQPAFSQLIHKLERTVDAQLLERSTRHVALTTAGAQFVDAARRIVADTEAAVATLRDHAAGRSGRVTIAALPSVAAEWLPAVIADYRAQHPAVNVELFDVLAERCLALVREGRADFAITASGPNLMEFETRPIYTDRYHLVCRQDHPLARRRSLRLRDLAGCELINMSRSTSVRQHLEPLLRDVPHSTTGLEVDQLATVAGLVASGLGVSLVPALTLFHFNRPGLATVPVDIEGLQRPILVVQQKQRKLSPAAAQMLALIEARLAATPPKRKRGSSATRR